VAQVTKSGGQRCVEKFHWGLAKLGGGGARIVWRDLRGDGELNVTFPAAKTSQNCQQAS
jgi:hypothetical protein